MTFFEIGSQVARYPGLVRRLVRDGDETCNHTFTHVLLAGVPEWQRQAQIELTEAAIAGVTGHYTRLIRPPYSATPDAVSPLDERVLAQVAGVALLRRARELRQLGLAPARRVQDRRKREPSRDHRWHRDAARWRGNRAQTVAALRQPIPRLRARAGSGS